MKRRTVASLRLSTPVNWARRVTVSNRSLLPSPKVLAAAASSRSISLAALPSPSRAFAPEPSTRSSVPSLLTPFGPRVWVRSCRLE